MMRKIFLSVLGLTLAAGGPLAIHWARQQYNTPGLANSIPSFLGSTSTADRAPTAPAAPVAADDTALEPTPIVDLSESLRMDLTPPWVIRHWPRVSTGMGKLQLQGYRVPLVTGTSMDDVAGSMTYYFNPRQQLQRIAFYGTTGVPQKLVGILASRYGFTRRIINDPSTFFYEVPDPSGHPKSFLQMQAFDVIKRSEPLKRFKVTLVIERPE